MKRQIREVRYFLSGQHFSDGLRITLAILIPSVVFYQFGHFETGLPVSLGALWASITDAPGPVMHRRNGMLAGTLVMVLVSLITGFIRTNIWLLGLEVALFSFFFSLFAIYGNRATSVGTVGLLSMILMIDRELEPVAVWQYAALVCAGGLWYTAISLSSTQLRPYRAAQQALGECIHEISKFLLIKAEFYSVRTDLQEDYRKLVTQQAVVSEKQDAVRELLFKTRVIMKESTWTGRLLVLTFSDVVDLYEQIIAMYYDYPSIRERFGKTGVLDEIARMIRQLAIEMDYIGLAIQTNRPYKSRADLIRHLERLKTRIDEIGQQEKDNSNFVLKKILINLRNLNQRLTTIHTYLSADGKTNPKDKEAPEYSRFVSHQEIDLKLILNSLTLGSSIFRHSLRMTVACLVGFLVAKLIAYGHHSYWILLTVSVILKPAFSLTKQRNYERIIGTIAGGLIGVAVLWMAPNNTVLFWVMVALMLGAYSFQRANYIVMVILMTPYILIMLRFLGLGGISVVEERVLDTLIGCAIAFAASYLFPRWESQQLKGLLHEVLEANRNYLRKLLDSLSGKPVTITDYKLARKAVYVNSANLSAAFQRMTSEPQSKQWHRNDIHEFVVLNHILSSNIATITSAYLNAERPTVCPPEMLRPVRRALSVLNESLKSLDGEAAKTALEPPLTETSGPEKPESMIAEDSSLKEQLDFIQKLSHDISKLTDTILT
ncbi:FUSC family membrane protein [Larkinella insperata]|uniref:FUSC family membrane protein n=1 Tax=Larkinella insperata TaxID=332158 RepID=A0ABW3QFS4_9BACT|nr:FUSC family membrane protein [Larkinella insperata]